MSPDLHSHIPEEILEEFAMDMLPEETCGLWEEHLLVCATCQDRVAEADEYIQEMKAAATKISRKGMKPMVAAVTHAALFLAYISASIAAR